MRPSAEIIQRAVDDLRVLYRAGRLTPDVVAVAAWLAEPATAESPPDEDPPDPSGSQDREGICASCGAKMVEYTFTFNNALATFLRRLHDADGPAKTDELGLTYSQRTNSQKLRYWNLAVPYVNEESKRKAGWWIITDEGRAFVRGESRIFRKVVMYRNTRVRYEGDQIYIGDVCDGYEYRSDYQDQASRQIRNDDNEAPEKGP